MLLSLMALLTNLFTRPYLAVFIRFRDPLRALSVVMTAVSKILCWCVVLFTWVIVRDLGIRLDLSTLRVPTVGLCSIVW